MRISAIAMGIGVAVGTGAAVGLGTSALVRNRPEHRPLDGMFTLLGGHAAGAFTAICGIAALDGAKGRLGHVAAGASLIGAGLGLIGGAASVIEL